MRNPSSGIGLAQLLIASGFLAATAFGHGGQRRPFPKPIAPPIIPIPSFAGPTDTTGPGNHSPGAAGSTAGGPGTGRRNSTATDGFDHWRFWWTANRERFYEVPQQDSPATETGRFLGRGGGDALVPLSATGRDQIMPVLERALMSEDFDTRAAALIAIGRVADAPIWSPRLLRSLRDPNRQVRESTGLALGILGTPNSLPLLLDALHDRTSARRLAARPNGLETRTRAFAAIGLGLIGEQRAVPDLIEVVQAHRSFASDDVPVAAVQALGLIGSARAVPTLMKIIEDRSASQRLRAAAPTALGRFGDANASIELRKLLSRPDLDTLVLWSALLATGRHWAGTHDTEAVQRLTHWMKDRNPQTRHFATISLGQVGGPEARRALLLTSLDAADTHQPWISLALAWLGREGEADVTLVARVRRSFQEAGSADAQSGHALALGLLRDTASAAAILRSLRETREVNARADLALAVGLLGDSSALAPLEGLLTETIAEPQVQWNAAIGLRLLGARLPEPRLRALWQRASTGLHRGTTAVAFGLARQPAAIDLLTSTVDDESAPDLSRALATVGLGLLGEKTWKSWRSHLVEDANYRALADFQSELYTIH